MFCKRVKEFLHTHNVTFTDRDITKDETALDDLQELGVMTTPVTVVDGQTIVGYDPAKLSAALNLKLDG